MGEQVDAAWKKLWLLVGIIPISMSLLVSCLPHYCKGTVRANAADCPFPVPNTTAKGGRLQSCRVACYSQRDVWPVTVTIDSWNEGGGRTRVRDCGAVWLCGCVAVRLCVVLVQWAKHRMYMPLAQLFRAVAAPTAPVETTPQEDDNLRWLAKLPSPFCAPDFHAVFSAGEREYPGVELTGRNDAATTVSPRSIVPVAHASPVPQLPASHVTVLAESTTPFPNLEGRTASTSGVFTARSIESTVVGGAATARSALNDAPVVVVRPRVTEVLSTNIYGPLSEASVEDDSDSSLRRAPSQHLERPHEQLLWCGQATYEGVCAQVAFALFFGLFAVLVPLVVVVFAQHPLPVPAWLFVSQLVLASRALTWLCWRMAFARLGRVWQDGGARVHVITNRRLLTLEWMSYNAMLSPCINRSRHRSKQRHLSGVYRITEHTYASVLDAWRVTQRHGIKRMSATWQSRRLETLRFDPPLPPTCCRVHDGLQGHAVGSTTPASDGGLGPNPGRHVHICPYKGHVLFTLAQQRWDTREVERSRYPDQPVPRPYAQRCRRETNHVAMHATQPQRRWRHHAGDNVDLGALAPGAEELPQAGVQERIGSHTEVADVFGRRHRYLRAPPAEGATVMHGFYGLSPADAGHARELIVAGLEAAAVEAVP